MTNSETGVKNPFGGIVQNHRSLLTSSPALIGQLGLLAVGGFVFWLVAARTSSADAVGDASQLYALVVILNLITTLGLPVLVARFGTGATERSTAIFAWALLLTAIASVAASTLTVVALPQSINGPLVEHGRPLGAVLLSLAVIGQGVGTLLDNRQVGLDQARQFLLRSFAMVALRVPLLAVTIGSRSLWLFVAATAITPAAVLLALVRHRKVLGPYRLGRIDNAMPLVRYAVVNYASSVLALAPFVVLPLVVFARVDAEDNAIFYLPWQFAAILFLVPGIISRALLIDATDSTSLLAAQVRTALLACTLFAAAAALAALITIPLFPLAYGETYDESGAVLLGLTLALIPYGVTATLLSVARIAADTRATFIIAAALTLAVLVPCSFLTPDQGTTGATLAWLVGHTIAAAPPVLYMRSRARQVSP